MAHAAPLPGTSRTLATRPGAKPEAHRPPDVLDPREHGIARIVGPVLIGLLYGYWAAANRRDAASITGWNLVFGFVCAIVFAALCIGVLTLAPRLRKELRALLWAVFTGVTFGFLYSQTGHSVLRSLGISLAIAVGVFVFDFYRYYTHDEPVEEHWGAR